MDTLIKNYIAAIIVLFVSSFGLTANALLIYAIFKKKPFEYHFSILLLSLSVADSGVLFIFLIWSTPMSITQSELSVTLPGKKMGQLCIYFWFASLYSTLAISVNRLLAISKPIKYKTIFTNRKTYITVGLCWAISILHIIVFFFEDCDMYYDNSASVWNFSPTLCGLLISWISDVAFDIVLILVIFIINLTTYIKMRRANRIINRSHGPTRTITDQNAENRQKAEIRLFKQSCIHVLIFMLEPISLDILSRYAVEFWGLFFTTTFAWQISHVCNSFVFIFFNASIRNFVHSIFTCKRSTNNG